MRILHRLEEAMIAILMVFMTVVTFWQVVLRYVFNSGLLWGNEATLYAFAWLVVFGLAYGVRTRAHLGIDIVVRMLAGPARRVVGLLAIGLSILYAAMLGYGAFIYVAKLYEVGIHAEDIEVPRWLLSAIMPIGFALLGIRLAYEGWLILTGKAQGFELADEARDALKDVKAPATGEGRP
jgi:C4-dicarboxylate transporter DctQ subunit